ncbi:MULTISPECIES: metal ABC transporter ATP-binding protein [unclassified Rothia (in: high G+C Gram-positive bacteria)]|uniref:metal ABC transporter ATP-binding protein n=1 Tax=unclassified Rothia (in: high G+C Gram-positive bacteria) TaxID=2689056 RepID=UPI0019588C3C|nr:MULTISPECIES: metal ABC transporter ATP-binding protein [unclassified Rothia (in: high G+C Gram-positive bacteria)]MBM7051634.1 metal ABC transporter ATP-binding protein [Rothia sp. ZJ1223]QRZ61735.1 metal ABC transporter ATP-binding protein [Rothia sp. ZJ932]
MADSVADRALATRPVLEVQAVSVRYREVQALERATLSLNRGTICGLVGMNGSGKSTLFKAIMGVVPSVAGTVQIAGMHPAKARAQGIVSYVPQSEDIDWTFPVSVRDVVSMGVYQNLGFTRRMNAQAHARVDRALAQIELTDFADRQIGELSGGQRKRAFVARAIAQQAQLFLLDEPFAGVDKRSEAMLVEVLKDLAAAGATVLVSTHDLQSLSQMADEVALLRKTIVMHGEPQQVLAPENLVTAFGMNVLGGEGQ